MKSKKEKTAPVSRATRLDPVIGSNVRRLREARDLTQDELVDLIQEANPGISFSKPLLSLLEVGKKPWNSTTIVAVCDIFKIEAFELMGGTPLTPEQAKKIQMMDEILALKAENAEIAQEIGLKPPGKKKPKPKQ